MPTPVHVQLSLIPEKLKKLRKLGREHTMQNSVGNVKNATAAMNIIEHIIEMRHNPTNQKIIDRERIPLLNLINKAMDEYADRHGYK